MTAFYNEIDPYAAQWLRNLIAAGHIAPGVVDERPIQEIEAYELVEFTQCHFFAGIGIWSHALRRAGWSDDRPIWTGSCPCQPFSNAGQKKGFQDDRHLWPYWKNLIDQCKPSVVIGEQVASALDWVDLVQTDLEKSGYAFGANDLCAAGFGGAHIRQRIYFVGLEYGAGNRRQQWWAEPSERGAISRCSNGRLADGNDTRSQGRGLRGDGADQRIIGATGLVGGVADGAMRGREPRAGDGGICRPDTSEEAPAEQRGSLCAASGLADGPISPDVGSLARTEQRQLSESDAGSRTEFQSADAPRLGRQLVDWLYCRDGKWRPVGPGTFPLVDETPSRVGRLRAYGNALDAETATQFCGAVREICDEAGI